MFPFSSWANIVSLNNSPATVSVACRQKRHANFRQREREREREREKDREGERKKRKKKRKETVHGVTSFLTGPTNWDLSSSIEEGLTATLCETTIITIRLSQSDYHNHTITITGQQGVPRVKIMGTNWYRTDTIANPIPSGRWV